MNTKIKDQKNICRENGFTLIEILVVIGLIALLAAIVIVAINPAKQFAQGRNVCRQSNIETILNAVGQRIADNKGTFAGKFGSYECPAMPSASTTVAIVYDNTNAVDSSKIDLSCLIPTYISGALYDPQADTSAKNSGYQLTVDNIGRVTICAPKSADETAIPGVTQICATR